MHANPHFFSYVFYHGRMGFFIRLTTKTIDIFGVEELKSVPLFLDVLHRKKQPDFFPTTIQTNDVSSFQ